MIYDSRIIIWITEYIVAEYYSTYRTLGHLGNTIYTNILQRGINDRFHLLDILYYIIWQPYNNITYTCMLYNILISIYMYMYMFKLHIS